MRGSAVTALLLLAAAACTNTTAPPPAPSPSPSAATAAVPFRDVAQETGLAFTHNPKLSGEYYLPEIMGAGVAVLDFDNDGDLDVFLVQSSGGSSQLFRNELVPQGQLRFTNVTAAARLSGLTGYGMGAAVGDFDNNGFADLYVTTAAGSNALLRNNGNGTFTDVTAAAGVDDPRWSASALFFDYDRDGWLDLFVANYVDFTPANNKACYTSIKERDYCSPSAFRPVPDRLFRNLGNGKFEDVTVKSGLTAADGPGLGVAAVDVNHDGFLDLYVANDGTPNSLWINRGGRTFEDTGLISASAVNANGQSQAGMGIAAGDIDNDGDEDILVTNMARETYTLYTNDGTGMFEDTTSRHALSQSTFASTGFGTGWFDYDHDGWLDLLAVNGGVTIVEERRGKSPYPYQQRTQLFRHEPGEARFTEVRGGVFDELAVARGAAFGDIDNDGDVDIVVSINNGPAKLLRNDHPANGNHWLKVRTAPGARVTVSGQTRRAGTDGSYLSASSPDVHFGLGQHAASVDIEVEWLGGPKQVFRNQAPDRLVVLTRPRAKR